MIVLAQNPAFPAPVSLIVPGKTEPVEVMFVFRALPLERMVALLRMTRTIKANWLQRAAAYLQLCWRAKRRATALDMLGEIIDSWEGFDVPYSREALGVLIGEFPGAHTSIFFTFLKHHGEARIKN